MNNQQEMLTTLNKLNFTNTPFFDWLKLTIHKFNEDQTKNQELTLDTFVETPVYFGHRINDDKLILYSKINDHLICVFLKDDKITFEFPNYFNVTCHYDNHIHLYDYINNKEYHFEITDKEYTHKEINFEGVKSFFDIFLYFYTFNCSTITINGLMLVVNICRDLPLFKEVYDQIQEYELGHKTNKVLLEEILDKDLSNIPNLSETIMKIQYDTLRNKIIDKMFENWFEFETE